MKPFSQYDLRAVIQTKWKKIYEKIDAFTNEEIMANDLTILADNIIQEFYIPTVEIFGEDLSRRKIIQAKIKKPIESIFREHYGKDYVEVDGVIMTFYYPFNGEKDLFSCRASTFSLGVYSEIELYKDCFSVKVEKSLNDMQQEKAKENLINSVNRTIEEIKKGISYANNDVSSFNNELRTKVKALLEDKKKRVETFFSISQMFEVPIEKKEYAENHIPLIRNINPIKHQYETEQYYGITDSDYQDILQTIKHTVSTYERTPSSYKTLQEEDLRNTLLAALNATYKGSATGETFRNAGKTDICIERENRAAFIAECKMWTGQNEVEKAIKQLDSYLTWRDCKTALIYFVRRKDFLKILETAQSALKNIDGMRSVLPKDKNIFECQFVSKSNIGQIVKIQVMLFNLYSE